MAFSRSKRLTEMAPVRLNENIRVPESVHTVFESEDIRERILDRVITYKSNFCTQSPEEEIHNLRLVSSSWLNSVNNILLKSGTPLIKLNIPENSKLLTKFVQMFGSNAPIFSLNISEQFFENGHFFSLQNCLIRCGSKLVELTIQMKNTAKFSCTLCTYQLPALRKLTVEISKPSDLDDVKVETQKEKEKRLNRLAKMGNFIKNLVKASDFLKELKILVDESIELTGYVLPETLSTVHIGLHGQNEIENFGQMKLPLVSNLNVEVFATKSERDQVCGLLSNWKKTLKQLSIKFEHSDELSTQIRFPIMQDLDQLQFTGFTCEFYSLDVCLPTITTMHLRLTPYDFRLLTENSLYRLVHTVKVELYQYPANPVTKLLPMNLQNIKNLKRAFPSVVKVGLTVFADMHVVIKYIFKEMQNLKRLELMVVGSERVYSSWDWDALLTGVNKEGVQKLLANRYTNMEPEVTDSLNIKCLSELEELYLETTEKFGYSRGKNPRSVISVVAFAHGIIKLPKLRLVECYERFKVAHTFLDAYGPGKNKRLTIRDTKPEDEGKIEIYEPPYIPGYSDQSDYDTEGD